MNISKIFELSACKTVLFNFRYFGMGGVFHPRVYVARNMVLRGLGGTVVAPKGKKIYLGFRNSGIVDLKSERGVWECGGKIVFGENVVLGSGVKVSCANDATITMGDDVTIIANSSLVCRKEVYVGKGSLISWDCLLMDSDFHQIFKGDCYINKDKEIIIEDQVWIGCRTTVLKGAHLKKGSVIGAGSLISKELEEENSVYVGNGGVINRNILWVH